MTGEGRLAAAPDMAAVRFGAMVREKAAQAAQAAQAAASRAAAKVPPGEKWRRRGPVQRPAVALASA